MEQVMTMERWNALSDADRSLLKTLGIEPAVVKDKKKKKKLNRIAAERRMSTRNTAPEEHYIAVTKVCNCCKTKVYEEGKMSHIKKSDTFLQFISMEIPVGEVFDRIKAESVTCPNCENKLGELSKEQLIAIIMALKDGNARKL